jgi:hypothetical protein
MFQASGTVGMACVDAAFPPRQITLAPLAKLRQTRSAVPLLSKSPTATTRQA